MRAAGAATGSSSKVFVLAANQIFILPGSLANAGTVLAKNALGFALHQVAVAPAPAPGEELPLPNIAV